MQVDGPEFFVQVNIYIYMPSALYLQQIHNCNVFVGPVKLPWGRIRPEGREFETIVLEYKHNKVRDY